MQKQIGSAQPTAKLPLVRLSLFRPILVELDQRGINGEEILESVGLSRAAVDAKETFIHVMVMHQLLENAAIAANDPYLLARIGERLDVTDWPPLVKAGEQANTVGEFFTSFIANAHEHATSARQKLNVEDGSAILSETRVFEPSIVPAQNDSFGVGFALAVLRRSVGNDWDPRHVTVVVCDPNALPPIFYGVQAVRGDRMGYRITFPSAWLLCPFSRNSFSKRSRQETRDPPAAVTMVDSMRQALRPLIGKTKLSVATACNLLHQNKRSVQRQLASEGTSLIALINELKCEAAIEELSGSDHSIAEIAAMLGFADPTSFSRSFKQWTGQSPRDYRKVRRAEQAPS
ncbi:MAG: helix-turn-helix domain-containing protein [Rhizobiaceae bacterium]